MQRHVDPAQFDAVSHEKALLPSRNQNLGPVTTTTSEALQEDSHAQFCGASSGGFEKPSSCAGRGSTNSAGPRRTKSKRNNWHVFDTPLFHDIGEPHSQPSRCRFLRGATMIPSLTGTLCSTPVQASSVPASMQISHNLAAHTVSTWLHGAYSGLDVIQSAIATYSESIVTPNSEKKLVCVKCELRTASSTKSKTSRTSRSGMGTRSKVIVNFSPWVAGPRTTRAVNWNTWNITRIN